MADDALVVDVQDGTEIDLPPNSDVIKSPILPEIKDQEKPDAKIELAADDERAEPVEPEVKEEKKAKKEEAPKVDESALTEAIRKQAELAAERDAALKEIEREKAERAKIESDLRKVGDTATRAYWEKINGERDLISQSLTFMQSEMDRLEASYEAAIENNDAKTAARINREMALQATKLRDLERGKDAVDDHIKKTERQIKDYLEQQVAAAEQPKPEPKKEPEKKQQTPDDWIAQFPQDTTGAWLKEHKDFVTDPSKNQQLIAFANYYGAKNGGKIHTKEFIDALNKEFNFSAPEPDQEDDVEEEAPKPEPKAAAPKKAAVAAPVSRSGNVFSSRNLEGTKIKLPPVIANNVKIMGLNPVKYAEGLVADIKAGKLPKNYLDPDYPHEPL